MLMRIFFILIFFSASHLAFAQYDYYYKYCEDNNNFRSYEKITMREPALTYKYKYTNRSSYIDEVEEGLYYYNNNNHTEVTFNGKKLSVLGKAKIENRNKRNERIVFGAPFQKKIFKICQPPPYVW